jgi:PAS domain S-box-containing protein
MSRAHDTWSSGGSAEDVETLVAKSTAMAATLRRVLDKAIPAVVLLSPEGIITYSNRAYDRITGHEYDTDPTVGERMSIHWTETTESVLSLDSFVGELDDEWHGEAMLKTTDGSLADVSITVVRLGDESGGAGRLGAVFTDASVTVGPPDSCATEETVHASCARILKQYQLRLCESWRQASSPD